MSDAAVSSTAAPAAPAQTGTPKKSSGGASKKPRVKPAHPRTSEMVNAAVKNLKERGGSSLQAIKKYIAANYKVDAEKLAPFIKKYLKSAVTSGALVQTKGKGASGSFKLSTAEKGETKKKSPVTKAKKSSSTGAKAKTTKAATKSAKPAAKKISAAKKSSTAAASKKTVAKSSSAPAAKKPAAAKPAKSPAKAKAAAKPKKPAKGSPTKKPKTPKPKKASAKPKSAAAKKAAPAKKK